MYMPETMLMVNLKQFFRTAMAARHCYNFCLKGTKLKSLNNCKERCEKDFKKYPAESFLFVEMSWTSYIYICLY